MRIVSVVPSQTELLYDLGLDTEVVGITKFCVHPEAWFRSKTRVGGTKTLSLDKIRALQPTLIIANKEENEKEQIETLMKEFPVWVSEIYTLEDALEMVRQVGAMTGKEMRGMELAGQIAKEFELLKGQTSKPEDHTSKLQGYFPYPTASKKAAYLIWRNPWMVAGQQTFINDMLRRCGLANIFDGRYPTIDLAQLKDCQLVLLSSEPYPFKQQHIEEIRAFCPNADIKLVDGEMFSWYGSRLLHAPAYFRSIFAGGHLLL
jgi:ABC-type Fe3+-hydroxamate transport system substrate-binding protein